MSTPTTTDTETIRDVISALGISATVAYADANPHMTDMGRDAYHYRVTLRRRTPRRSMTVPFSCGSAWTREPDAADVLDCLLSDASGYDNADGFADWCAEYGYEEDSRKAEGTYKAIARQSAALRRFLGDDYDRALAAERL
jgi:hypothetical protein